MLVVHKEPKHDQGSRVGGGEKYSRLQVDHEGDTETSNSTDGE